MLPTSIIVAIQDIKTRIPEGDLVAKLKFAMSEAKQHWLLAKEDEQFRAAVGAVMMHTEKVAKNSNTSHGKWAT